MWFAAIGRRWSRLVGALGISLALAGHETFADMQLLRVTAGEEYAANCVRVKNVILVAEGYPGTRSRLCMRP